MEAPLPAVKSLLNTCPADPVTIDLHIITGIGWGCPGRIVFQDPDRTLTLTSKQR